MLSISVDNINKKYKQYSSAWPRLCEWFLPGNKVRHRERWVLKDITFKVKQGEAVGIIGQNGAGKSTLLKILTGTTMPTSGKASITGRVSALLELGMGFHYEFTGRQNAIMGCQMLGLDNSTIAERLPDIIEFSELGDYFERPLRTFSSGMQVRLAFSVATCVQPEVLIIDEALSVGDIYFQHKSMNRIREFQQKGTTLLFVSHDPGAVKSLCNRAILLDRGVLIKEGNPEAILDYYNAMLALKEKDETIKLQENQNGKIETRSGNKFAQINKVNLLDEKGKESRAFIVGQEATIKCEFQANHPIEDLTVGLLIRDRLGNDIFGTNTNNLGLQIKIDPNQKADVSFYFPVNLGPGSYSITLALHKGKSHIQENFDWWDNIIVFQVLPSGHIPDFIGASYLPVNVNHRKLN